MSTPFQAITTGGKSIAESVTAPLRAVKSDFAQKRKTAEATYDALDVDYTGLPNNQVQLAQAWGDAVRENLVEGYRTNNQDLIRQAKQQGRSLTSYITTMQQDYSIGRGSVRRAEEKQYQDLSNSREEITAGFKNRYEAPLGYNLDERGYPKNLSIDGTEVAIGEFVNNMKDNPFMVVDAVDFGGGFVAEKNAARHSSEIISEPSSSSAQSKGVEFANIDIENGKVSNDDLAVLYVVRNKLIEDVNNPTEAEVKLIQEISSDPKRLEEAKDMYIKDYSDFLVNAYETREQAVDKSDKESAEKQASQGILSIDPVVEQVEGQNLAMYYMDVEGVSFKIRGNERVSAVGIDDNGNVEFVKVIVTVKDPISGVSTYNEVSYSGDTLTDETKQLVRNRIEIKAPKQINGYNRFVDKAQKVLRDVPEPSTERTPEERQQAVIDAINAGK
tara:strand:+ start:844 stop:2175 length:1332 start_codon:yes stop_codon:yes gene_type:complete